LTWAFTAEKTPAPVTNEESFAAWSYEAPKPAMRHVDRWIGFWEDVKVE
jgi:uncharacterized protein (DUF427 family)